MTWYRAAGTLRGGRPKRGARPDAALVQDALAGYARVLDPRSLAVVLDRLDKGSWSAEELARRLGCSQRTVQRHRARRRAEAEQQRKGQAA